MLCQPRQEGLPPRPSNPDGTPRSPRPPNPDGTPNAPRPPAPIRLPEPEGIRLSPRQAQERQLQWAHEQNLEDTSRLIKLSQELKWDLANHDRQILSLATVKKMEEIERLIRKIRARVGKS
jgi:hypothetical protein